MSNSHKRNQKGLALAYGPRSGPSPWARRDGPSMAQHGSPGIHAGRHPTQTLLSASRRGGQIKSTARRGGRPAGLVGGLHSRSVAADEPCEAAIGLVRHCDAAVVKSASSVYQVNRVFRFCDRCVIERSLALLVSGLSVGAKTFCARFCGVCHGFCFCWSHTYVQTTRIPITVPE